MPMMRGRHWTAAALLVMVLGVALFVIRDGGPAGPQLPSGAEGPGSSVERSSGIGFRTPELLQQHYEKHGREFGASSREEYLREAQALRDAPLSDPVLEIRRQDGVVSRFDRSTGSFIAVNADGTIRTFFRPNDGERYFRRQATREH